jgi:hypothetical protein
VRPATRPKPSRLKPLGPNRVTVVVPVQDFDAVGDAIDEHEQMAGQRIILKMILDNGGKPIERLPHVNRFRRNINRLRNAAQHNDCAGSTNADSS